MYVQEWYEVPNRLSLQNGGGWDAMSTWHPSAALFT